MKSVLLIGVALLLIGPLRRRLLLPFLAAWWRTVLPLVVGGAAAIVIVGSRACGVPAEAKIIGLLLATFMIGGGVRELLNEVFPRKGE